MSYVDAPIRITSARKKFATGLEESFQLLARLRQIFPCRARCPPESSGNILGAPAIESDPREDFGAISIDLGEERICATHAFFKSHTGSRRWIGARIDQQLQCVLDNLLFRALTPEVIDQSVAHNCPHPRIEPRLTSKISAVPNHIHENILDQLFRVLTRYPMLHEIGQEFPRVGTVQMGNGFGASFAVAPQLAQTFLICHFKSETRETQYIPMPVRERYSQLPIRMKGAQ